MILQSKIDNLSIQRRRISLWGAVDDDSAKFLVERLLYLDQLSDQDIELFIHSPGGSTSSGMAVVDVIHSLRSDVSTVCLGLAASFGAVLLACGTKGKRFAFPHARIMIHQPWVPGRIEAPATDLRIHALEITKTRRQLNQILADASGKTLEDLENDSDRDYWMDVDEARNYGLIDGVYTPAREGLTVAS